MIVDTSALLAVLFEEEHGPWIAAQLDAHAGELAMSTVNLAETLIRLKDRQPRLFAELEERLLASGIRFVPPDAEQARLAADARLRFPLNLGDCFAYALAQVEKDEILTLDRDFGKTDAKVLTAS